MGDLKRIIGGNISKKRNELKLTQEELSSISKVAMITISKLERFMSLPSPDTLLKLALALHTDINYFFIEDNSFFKEETEVKLILIYQCLSLEKQLNLLEYADFLFKNESKK